MRALRELLLPVLMVLVGVAIVIRTLAEGGSLIAIGVISGVLFVLAGGLRLYAGWRGNG